MSLPVGVQIYSVREEAAADFEGTLKRIKEYGYDGVEFAGLYGRSPEEVRALCQSIGLVPVSAHVPYADMVADPEGVLGQYARIGCSYVAIPYLTPDLRPGTPGFGQVVENAAKLGRVAHSLGMQLLYHNHDFEFTRLDGEYALDLLYRSVPADLLQTEFDTCWVKVAGEDPVAYLDRYAGRSPVVHLKDFAGSRSENMYKLIGIKDDEKQASQEKFAFRPVGKGVQDWPPILEASVRAGAKWLVVEQDSPSLGLTPLESIRESRAYLKTLGY